MSERKIARLRGLGQLLLILKRGAPKVCNFLQCRNGSYLRRCNDNSIGPDQFSPDGPDQTASSDLSLQCSIISFSFNIWNFTVFVIIVHAHSLKEIISRTD